MPEHDLPYFPLYPRDLLSDEHVMAMDTAAFGAYVKLLCFAWHSQPPATIPDDPPRLARLAGIADADWSRVWLMVAPCWTPRSKGRLEQKRLRAEWEKANSFMESRIRGGQNRWRNSLAKAEHEQTMSTRDNSGSDSSCSGSPDGGGMGEVSEAPPTASASPWTREQFAIAAISLGCSDPDRDHCWAHYDSQGWQKSSGRAISGDPRSLLTSWLANTLQTQPAPTGAQGDPVGTGVRKRQAWQVESDIKSLKTQIHATTARIDAKRGSGTDADWLRDWKKKADPADVATKDRQRARLKKLEIELQEAL